MKIKRLVMAITLLLVFAGNISIAQQKLFTTVTINQTPKTNFAFTKKWAYPWYMVKDDKGKLSKAIDGKITKADKAHLYFTADCKTNVQGGYNIRYCYASKASNGTITLNFRDGEPAYANEFKVILMNGNFGFTPQLTSPMFVAGRKVSYKTTRQSLTIHQKNYGSARVISGYIDVEFSEVVTEAGRSTEHPFYLKGYFKTPVN